MDDNKKNIIGKRIKDAMIKSGLKQADIVKKTGINKGALSSYLSGKYEPKQTNIYKLAKALDVTPAWLMGYNANADDKTITENDFLIVEKEIENYKEKQVIKSNDIKNYIMKLIKTLDNQHDELIFLCLQYYYLLNDLLSNKKISENEYKKYIKNFLNSKVINNNPKIKEIFDIAETANQFDIEKENWKK